MKGSTVYLFLIYVFAIRLDFLWGEKAHESFFPLNFFSNMTRHFDDIYYKLNYVYNKRFISYNLKNYRGLHWDKCLYLEVAIYWFHFVKLLTLPSFELVPNSYRKTFSTAEALAINNIFTLLLGYLRRWRFLRRRGKELRFEKGCDWG